MLSSCLRGAPVGQQLSAMTSIVTVCVLCLALAMTLPYAVRGQKPEDYGREIGELTTHQHEVSGTVYVVDDHTILIKSFSYDGKAPDVFFWMGTTERPSSDGTIIPFPVTKSMSNPKALEEFKNQNIILRLPTGKTILDYKWLAVWCRQYSENFADIYIPPFLEVPHPQVLPEFSRLKHSLRSGKITVLDSRTFSIPNLHYDGTAPAAFFWVGHGAHPDPNGRKIPDENGSTEKLKRYTGQNITITLPDDLTVYDIDYLGMWCVIYKQNFGFVTIPKTLNVPPHMGQLELPVPDAQGNCREVIPNRLQVEWQVDNDKVQIQLVGRIQEDEYMSFGLIGEDDRSELKHEDIVVTFYDKETDNFTAVDYFVTDLAECDGTSGICPDELIGGNNDAVFLTGTRSNGVTMIMYTRPLMKNDNGKDITIPTNQAVHVSAAIGKLNSKKEASVPTSSDRNPSSITINFSSTNDNTCTKSLFEVDTKTPVKPWSAEKILKTKSFTAVIGPSGDRRGYTSITGLPSWGKAWWINNLLIPEIYVERGQTYTFLVSGGKDISSEKKYHPLYITNSKEGGFGKKTDAEGMKEEIFAGTNNDASGGVSPIAAGPYCEYVPKSADRSLESNTFADFFKTVHLKCEDGKPAILEWTVAEHTPDTVYYQSYTHKFFGWKIHVVNKGFAYPMSMGGGVRVNISHYILGIQLFVVAVISFTR